MLSTAAIRQVSRRVVLSSARTHFSTLGKAAAANFCAPTKPDHAASPTCACARCRSVNAGRVNVVPMRFLSANPQGGSGLEASLDENFAGAVTNSELVSTIQATLAKHGFGTGPQETLVATSLCADEVNRVLEQDLAEAYGMPTFSMGGLAGFPFGGVTAFGAMASHIPDGGSCLVVFGPHVGVDSDGSVGTVARRGRAAGGACCGSAVAASGYVASVKAGDTAEAGPPTAPLDAQQTFVGNMLLPYADHLDAASNKMVDLPYALYDSQKKMVGDIVGKAAGAVSDGKVAVLGGIQLNTPPEEGTSDYFLPLSLEVYDNTGALVADLSSEIGCGSMPEGL